MSFSSILSWGRSQPFADLSKLSLAFGQLYLESHPAPTRLRIWIQPKNLTCRLNIIAVIFYRCPIGNTVVLQKPLNSRQASECIQWYRESSGWLQCAWEPALMKELYPFWENSAFPARNSFDLKLAITLKYHGVEELYTRNIKNFTDLNFFSLFNPLAML